MTTATARTIPRRNGSAASNIPPPPEIRFRWEFVTPESAAQYLEANYHRNRRPRQGWVDQLGDFIASGQFRPIHHAIAFDEDGNLIDGQHRLMAIVKAGKGAWIPIAEGVRLEDVVAIDFGVKRTAVDQARIGLNRDDITKTTVSTARAMHTGFVSWVDRGTSLQQNDLFDFIDRHREAIAFVERWTSRKVLIAPVLAVVAKAYYYADAAELARFLDILTEGVADGPIERGVVRLRDVLLSWKGRGGSDVRAQVQRKTTWALKAFLERRIITRVVEATEDPFPLAGEDRLSLA